MKGAAADFARRLSILRDRVRFVAAHDSGLAVVVLTDELNTWAAALTPHVFFVRSKAHAYVESSGPLASLLSLVTHSVAAQDPARAKARLAAWPALLRELALF